MVKTNLPLQAQEELMQLFLDVPGLTKANDQYGAEIRKVSESGLEKIGVRFGVRQEATTPDEVQRILTDYIRTMVNSDIDGISFDDENSQLIMDDTLTMAVALNEYLEKNPENLAEDIIEGIGNKLNFIVSKAYTSDIRKDDHKYGLPSSSSKAIAMASKFLILMQQVPKQIWSNNDVIIGGKVNENGSIEISLNYTSDVSETTKEKLDRFLNFLDENCVQDPNRFSYDADDNIYIFSSAQEIYDFMRDYFYMITPEGAEKNIAKRDFETQKIMAFAETLESIFDDVVVPFTISKAYEFDHPKSVTAVVKGLRTVLNQVEGTDTFYINPEQQKDKYIFTIGCSEFTREEHSEDKNDVLEKAYDFITSYPSGPSAKICMLFSGDNFEIEVADLRDMIPFFKSVYEEYNLGGPEEIEYTARDEDNNFVKDDFLDHQQVLIGKIPSNMKESEVFDRIPIRTYNSLDAAMAASVLREHAPAVMAIHNIEATIKQEYGGYKAQAKLPSVYKPYTVH